MKWISVSEKLPDIDEYVLWLYESGGIFYECLDKDWFEDEFYSFLKGNDISGPITHWWHPVYSHEKDLDRKNLEWLVWETVIDGFISISKGRELLGFESMEQMREWLLKEGE